MPAVAANSAIPPLTFAAGSCNSLGGQCVINPANPSVYIQAAPPAGDSFYIVPVLSYSTTNQAITNELGTRWVHTFKRQVQASGTVLTVVTGSGQSYSYSASHIGGGFASPTSNAVNSLQSSVGFTNFTETQPDGTVYQYGAPVSGTAPLLYIQNPAGADGRSLMTAVAASVSSPIPSCEGRPWPTTPPQPRLPVSRTRLAGSRV